MHLIWKMVDPVFQKLTEILMDQTPLQPTVKCASYQTEIKYHFSLRIVQV